MPYIAKKTLITIISSGNDYVICVKRDQKCLYKQIEETCRSWSASHDYLKKVEKNRDRIETRKIYLYKTISAITQSWEGSKIIIKLVRERIHKGKLVSKTWYYISSKEYSAEKFCAIIRGHWLIENRLHWIKDAVMKEDKSPIRNYRSAPVMSIFRTIVLNMIRKSGCGKIKDFMQLISHNIEQMLSLAE